MWQCVVMGYTSPPKPLGKFVPNFAGMFLGRSSLKMFTEFDFIKISGCHGKEMELFRQFFENPFLWKCWSDFEIISQESSLSDPFQNCL